MIWSEIIVDRHSLPEQLFRPLNVMTRDVARKALRVPNAPGEIANNAYRHLEVAIDTA